MNLRPIRPLATGIGGRLLYPPVCSCPQGCRSREEMTTHHGTLPEFEDALASAIEDGSITHVEANRALHSYRAEWARAPEKAR